MKIEKEDFDAWLDNIVTQAVFAYVKALVEQAKEKWMQVSWDGGTADPLMLADLRARAEIASDLIAIEHKDITDDEERKRHPADRV